MAHRPTPKPLTTPLSQLAKWSPLVKKVKTSYQIHNESLSSFQNERETEPSPNTALEGAHSFERTI